MAAMEDVVNSRRERDTRLGPIEAALAGESYAQRQAASSQAPQNSEGVWDDTTGTYRKFFRLGVSRFGDGSVLGGG